MVVQPAVPEYALSFSGPVPSRYTLSSLSSLRGFLALNSYASRRIVEQEIHESIVARTDSLQGLRELGPPDLVHLIKSQPKSAVKEVESTSFGRLAC